MPEKGPGGRISPIYSTENKDTEFRFFPVTLSSLRVHFIPFSYADSLTMFSLPDVWEEGFSY